MATYAWRGRNGRGELVEGQLDAMGEGAVADQLMSMGVAPVHIAVAVADAASGGAEQWWVRLNRKAVSVEDILVFSRQMYTLSKAGVPILRAFAGLQASAVKPAMVELLQDIRSSLDQGRELSVALQRHVDVFGAFYVAMIRVGEMTGRLTEVFLRLNEHMEFERDVRERIKQAMRYPSFVIIAMVIALVVINVFVIPVFAKVFAGFNAELPLITRGLLGFSSWMVAWWHLLLAAVIGAVVMVRAYLRTPGGALPLGQPQAEAADRRRHRPEGNAGPLFAEFCAVQRQWGAPGPGPHGGRADGRQRVHRKPYRADARWDRAWREHFALRGSHRCIHAGGAADDRRGRGDR